MVRRTSQTPEVERIAGLGDADARVLLEHEVSTVDDLWGDGGGDLAGRLQSTADAARIRRELLYALLIADALQALRPKGWARARLATAKRWRGELTFVALLLLAVTLLAYRGYKAGGSFVPRVAVKAGSHLTAFRAINPTDLTLTKAIPVEGTFSSVEEVAGRYPSETVPAGGIVNEAHLLRKELSGELGRRHLLVIPVKHGTTGQTIKTPVMVWLLFPPTGEKNPTALLVKDVMLLSIRHDGEKAAATIAVTEIGLAEMKDYAGRTEALIIQPAT